MQAAIVKLLVEAWQADCPDVGQACLLEEVQSESKKLQNIFGDNPAFGWLIVPGPRNGLYRMADPQTCPSSAPLRSSSRPGADVLQPEP